MSWYDDNWRRRAAVSVNNLAGAVTIDASLVIPPEWDDFWDNLSDTTNAYDVVLTDADGITRLSYDLSGFVFSTRTLTVRANDYASPDANALVALWLYWSRTSAPNVTAPFTPVGPKTANVLLASPAAPVLRGTRERPGDLRPLQRVAKNSGETLHVWWDVESLLERRTKPHQGSLRFEEIDYARIDVTLAGVSQTAPSMFTQGETRFVNPGWIRTTILGGTDGSNYTLSLTVGTTEGRILNPRALLQVRDVDEA